MSNKLTFADLWTLARSGLVIAPILLVCLLSPSALIALGVDYVLPGGNAIAKVHPGTYASCVTIFIFMCTGSFQKITDVIFLEKPSLLYFYIALVLLFVYAAAFLAVPFMPLIDVWFLAGAIVIMISALTLDEKWFVARAFDIFMTVNSALGIIETVRNWRLIPLTQWSGTLGQYVYPVEWRSTAFLGHPLANSYVVGAYVLSLLITKRMPNLLIKLPLMALHLVALLSFGSRVAFVLLGVGIVVYVTRGILRAVTAGRIAADILILTSATVPLAVIVTPIILVSGYADRYIERFSNDRGSARARNIAFDLLQQFSVHDLIFGPPDTLLFSLLKRYNLIALESFWLNFLFTFGIVGCVIFFPAIYILCRVICKQTSNMNAFILFYFFLCCSTSLSISSKSLIMGITTAMCMTNLDFAPLRKKQMASSEAISSVPVRYLGPGLTAPGAAFEEA